MNHPLENLTNEKLKTPILKKRAKQFYSENKSNVDLIKDIALALMAKDEYVSVVVGTELLARILNSVDKEKIVKLVYKLSDSTHWEVRESIATFMKKLLEHDFDYYLKLFSDMTLHTSVNVRRAPVVGSMNSKLGKDKKVILANKIYKPLLNDPHIYIRKNLGPFALSDFLRLHPNEAVKKFEEWLPKALPIETWNILGAFQLSRVKNSSELLEKAQEFLKNVEKTELKDHKMVRNAILSLERRIKVVSTLAKQ